MCLRHNLNIKVVQTGQLIHTKFFGSKMAAAYNRPNTSKMPKAGPAHRLQSLPLLWHQELPVRRTASKVSSGRN